MKARLVTMKRPPIDLGFGIYDNATVFKLSLVFFDLLINLRDRDLLVGAGIPFYRAWCLHIAFGHSRNKSAAPESKAAEPPPYCSVPKSGAKDKE